MIASKLELEQMAKDGKGRASVVKALAEAALNVRELTETIEPEHKEGILRAFALMASEWPNTTRNVFYAAWELMNRDGMDKGMDYMRWWWQLVHNLPEASKKILEAQ